MRHHAAHTQSFRSPVARRRWLLAATIVAGVLPAAGLASAGSETSAPDGTVAEGTEATDTTVVSTEVAVTVTTAVADTAATTAAATETTAAGAEAATAAVIYDDEGTEVATVTLGEVTVDWADHAEDAGPDEGRSYVRVVATVARAEGGDDFGVNINQFILQDVQGNVYVAESVQTAEQAANEEEQTTETDLAAGESIEFAFVFDVDPTIEPSTVYYRPDEETLVTVGALAA